MIYWDRQQYPSFGVIRLQTISAFGQRTTEQFSNWFYVECATVSATSPHIHKQTNERNVRERTRYVFPFSSHVYSIFSKSFSLSYRFTLRFGFLLSYSSFLAVTLVVVYLHINKVKTAKSFVLRKYFVFALTAFHWNSQVVNLSKCTA